MAVTDLTGTKWKLKDTLTYIDDYEFSVLFENNGYNFNKLTITVDALTFTNTIITMTAVEPINGKYLHTVTKLFEPDRPSDMPYWSWCDFSGNAVDYSNCPWLEFTFTGGTDATNANLISWIQSNAEQIIDSPVLPSFSDVDVTPHEGYITMTINGVDFNLKTAASN